MTGTKPKKKFGKNGIVHPCYKCVYNKSLHQKKYQQWILIQSWKGMLDSEVFVKAGWVDFISLKILSGRNLSSFVMMYPHSWYRGCDIQLIYV